LTIFEIAKTVNTRFDYFADEAILCLGFFTLHIELWSNLIKLIYNIYKSRVEVIILLAKALRSAFSTRLKNLFEFLRQRSLLSKRRMVSFFRSRIPTPNKRGKLILRNLVLLKSL